jgi:hypothetical protein
MRFRQKILLALLLALLTGALVLLAADFQLPAAPGVEETYTPRTRAAPQEIGSWDVLGCPVGRAQAAALLRSAEGRRRLTAAAGAVEVTPRLLALGRAAFYEETYGNEVFFTDVLGTIDGPINVVSLGRAILALHGAPTTDLRVRLDDDARVGGRLFPAGTLLHTGLDVPPGALLPLGMRIRLLHGDVKVGITCAACHATLDAGGRILEGAPNSDVNTGLLLAFATNSAAFFRQTGVDPVLLPAGPHTYLDGDGHLAKLPDPRAVEDAVDADLLSWAPGNFDSTGDLTNNPSQTPSSYTFGAWPYGWSGFASVGWFHGLTTLNNNVHATNSDPTTGADASPFLLGIDKEAYLGVIFQNAARLKLRLLDGERPSSFFRRIDPTPGAPELNRAVRMPGYPRGSIFILDGLMANTPGLPVAAELNGMSAWQNTLAPPPVPDADLATLRQGAAVFTRAGCGRCHSGRFLTDNRVLPQPEVGTQPSRARALAAFPKIFAPPRTYPPAAPVPLPAGVPSLPVPLEITPPRTRLLAYAQGDPAGGYKVPSLIGLAVTAPYLHDGGVAAARGALRLSGDRFVPARPDRLGLAGTLRQARLPDPAASLRVLVDRRLRAAAVAANRADPGLRRSNADGSGHAFWVDPEAGFTAADQTALIRFLLSLDDDPQLLP